MTFTEFWHEVGDEGDYRTLFVGFPNGRRTVRFGRIYEHPSFPETGVSIRNADGLELFSAWISDVYGVV